ncbi:MAG: hypothetical protein L0Y54_08035 [Sporichthyaceae bacterium]|nr:hypothetical protein [Sporichthyaceae bacterium]
MFSTKCSGSGALGWIETTDGSSRADLLAGSAVGTELLERVPGTTDQLIMVPPGLTSEGTMRRVKLAGTSGITVLAGRAVGSTKITDIDVVDATRFILTRNKLDGDSGFASEFVNLADLTFQGSLSLGNPMVGVSVAPDGFVAVGWRGSNPQTQYHGDFAIYGATDRTHIRRIINFVENTTTGGPLEQPVNRGIEWSGSGGSLFGVTMDQAGGNLQVHPLTDPRRIDSGGGVFPPEPFFHRFGEQFSFDILAGPTHFSPPPTGNLVVTRTDRLGTETIASPPISLALGARYTVTDTPRITGFQRYTASYAGDALYLPGSNWQDEGVVAVGADLTGDFIEDLAIGAPYEDYGSISDSGTAAVLPGGSGGVTGNGGLGFNGTKDDYDQGGREAGDRFGYSSTLGDFDGNGFADLAVSTPYENANLRDQGAVRIYWAAEPGGGAIAYHDTLLGTQIDQRLGYALSSGDFDGDFVSDLVIGARDEHVRINLYGAGTQKMLSQDSGGVPGTRRSGERHGAEFAVGDLNGDGFQDLAVGAPDDRDDRGFASGAVTIHYGSPTGPRGTGSQRWSLDSAGVSGSPATGNPSAATSTTGSARRWRSAISTATAMEISRSACPARRSASAEERNRTRARSPCCSAPPPARPRPAACGLPRARPGCRRIRPPTISLG